MYFRISIIHFWISINRILDIKYSTDFLDILKMIYGYLKMIFGYPKITLYFWISIIHFWMSKNENIFNISNIPLIFGYPKMYFRISINPFLDIKK